MFKSKIKLLNRDWNEVFSYKSRMKPIEGEYLYIDDLKSYYKVITVIHSLINCKEIILIVDKVEGLKKG